MADLERDLEALATLVELPAERDLVPVVRARLAERRRRGRPIRRLVVAAAVLVLALGVALAVPEARSAILRLLGLESVTVIRVDSLPPASSGPAAPGQRLSLGAVAGLLGFEPLLARLGYRDAVHVDLERRSVILLYGRPRARLRLAEMAWGRGLVRKLVRIRQGVESVSVGGAAGLWIEGPRVVLEVPGPPRLSGSALLWERNGLLLRLEGHMTREEALHIARSAG